MVEKIDQIMELYQSTSSYQNEERRNWEKKKSKVKRKVKNSCWNVKDFDNDILKIWIDDKDKGKRIQLF